MDAGARSYTSVDAVTSGFPPMSACFCNGLIGATAGPCENDVKRLRCLLLTSPPGSSVGMTSPQSCLHLRGLVGEDIACASSMVEGLPQ